MSETIEIYKAMGDHKKRLRAIYGINCPVCAQKRPKTHPTILLPKQRCRVDGYIDPRPDLTDKQYQDA